MNDEPSNRTIMNKQKLCGNNRIQSNGKRKDLKENGSYYNMNNRNNLKFCTKSKQTVIDISSKNPIGLVSRKVLHKNLSEKLERFNAWGEYDTSNYFTKRIFQTGKHAELVALLEDKESGKRIIKKRYPHERMNIFYNEALQLSKLTECPFAPKLLKVRAKRRTLYMSFCGSPLKEEELSSYEKTIKKLQKELEIKWKIFHNDIKLGNICKLGKQLYFIDFGWASDKPLKAGYGIGCAGFQNDHLFIS